MSKMAFIGDQVKKAIFILSLVTVLFASGCWLAVGAAGAGTAYEYSNKKQMDELEEDYKAGNIDQEEYESRKQQIEEGSIIY